MNTEWKTVPATMTLDMCVAFAEAWFSKVRCIDDPEMQDAYAAMLAAAPPAPTSHPIPTGSTGDRDWELSCNNCNGSGHVFVKRQVAERKTDVQEFKEECEACEGRGFNIAFEDIPGIAEYVPKARPAPSAPGDAQDEQRAQDGKRPDLDWIEGIRVTDTVGRGWCVRIDGTDIFEDVNRYGCKGRRSFQIADGLASKQLAQRAAVEWLSRQLSALAAPAAGDELDAARYRWIMSGRTVPMAGPAGRDHPRIRSVMYGDRSGNLHAQVYAWGKQELIDAAIDAAIAQQKGEA